MINLWTVDVQQMKLDQLGQSSFAVVTAIKGPFHYKKQITLNSFEYDHNIVTLILS